MPHIHTEDNQYDYTASGHIVNQGRVLLIRHKKLPIWTPPSGHIELHQTPTDALFMEIEEEAGISSDSLTLIETHAESKEFRRKTSADKESHRVAIPFDIDSHQYGDLPHYHIDFGYILTSTTDRVNPGKDESQEYKWFTAEELDGFTETTPIILDRCKYAISYVSSENKAAL